VPAATPIETVTMPPIPSGCGIAAAATACRTRSATVAASWSDVREDEQHLLAPEAVRGVGSARLAADRRAQRAQRLVACQVPEAVVVGLEAVEVAQRQRVRLAALAGALLDDGQVLGQRPAVVHPGQRVAAQVLGQALVRPCEVGLAGGEQRPRRALPGQEVAQPAVEQDAAGDERRAGPAPRRPPSLHPRR